MGIFEGTTNVFTTYHVVLQLREKIVGGTPKNPKAIEGWLRTKAGITDTEEVRRAMLRTLRELGADVNDDDDYEALVKASEALAVEKQTNGFKLNAEGLYIESRQVKAMIKECTNILYAGQKWGKIKTDEQSYNGKGPRSFVAERVFVNPPAIQLGVNEPSGVDLFIGHVSGPQGPRSTMTYVEYVWAPRISFDVLVTRDSVDQDRWAEIWEHAQENGLGALRSQDFGRFDIVEWRHVKGRALKSVDEGAA